MNKDDLILCLKPMKANILPPAGLYAELIAYVANKHGLKTSECRERFGNYTVNNWITLLS